MIKLEVKTYYHPTEDWEILKNAINSLYDFENIIMGQEDDSGIIPVSAEAEGIESLKFMFKQVRRQRIVQALRNQALSTMDLNNDELEFMLNKQALTRNKISYCSDESESPLDPIWIKISSDNIEYLINWLFPETEKGKVLEVNYTPES